MTDVTLFVWGIIAILIIILLTLGFLLIYSGLFTSFDIGAGKPPVQNLYVGYKFGQGPYKECGALFTEAAACAPGSRCFGIYYDNPQEVEPDKTRYVIGAILAEGTEKSNEEVETLMKKRGFKFHNLPAVSSCVRTSFPYNTPLSVYMLVSRVYPAMARYVEEHRLCAHPFMEIYSDNTIHIMAPLAKQENFYVPEVQENDVNDDATTEYSNGSFGDSSVERQEFPFLNEQSRKDAPPTVQLPKEPKPTAVDADGDQVAQDESPVEPSPPVANGNDSGSEASTGTTSSFEQVNMDMEELKTPDVESKMEEEVVESEQLGTKEEVVAEKQTSAEPERQE
ncbi:testis-expressed protein 264 homolog [Lineus longissimus]|uniref:testis-expressed protein 264 homolog n=1 Tax=Lineus longissimus TaxID=88925 RepID=UPI002B4D76D8